MPKFGIQVGRSARVYYTATIEAESLEAAKEMNSRHGFNAPDGAIWVKDGVDDFDAVETVNIYCPDTAETLAAYSEGDGWEKA